MSRRGISGAGSAEPTQHERKGYLRSVLSFPHVAHGLLAFCILQRDLGRLVASLQPQPAENLKVTQLPDTTVSIRCQRLKPVLGA
jgi:hypothetical protein